MTFTLKYPKGNIPKKLSSHVVVKASLKATYQNHNETEKILTLKTSISACPHLQTGFLGVTVSTHAYLHEQHFIFMWHPRLLQEIELECDKKFHLSNRKVLIMAEASSLAEFFLHRNVTYKLLKQNCKTNVCGNAYCFKVHSFCQNFFDWLQNIWNGLEPNLHNFLLEKVCGRNIVDTFLDEYLHN